MKTMDEKSALAPVLVLDEEEAIEDLSETICASLRSRCRQSCRNPVGRICFLLPQLRTSACRGGRLLPEARDPVWRRRRDAATRGSVGERSCRSAGKS